MFLSVEMTRRIYLKNCRTKDGKLVDHMFIGQGLIEKSNIPAELTYYIGDSKYYKRTKNDTIHLGDNSIYKQYTYAKNVIQWNMNLFLDGDTKDQPQIARHVYRRV